MAFPSDLISKFSGWWWEGEGGGGGGGGGWQNPRSPGGARLWRLIFNPSVRTLLRNGPATPPTAGWGEGGGGVLSFERRGDARRLA